MMYGHEKSRSAIVAVKPTNKAERSAAEQFAAEPTAAESVEQRAETKGNVDQQSTRRTQRRISVSQMLARIRQHIFAVDTRGGNRMRESCMYGSVRGVRGNSHPYRDGRCMSPSGHRPLSRPFVSVCQRLRLFLLDLSGIDQAAARASGLLAMFQGRSSPI